VVQGGDVELSQGVVEVHVETEHPTLEGHVEGDEVCGGDPSPRSVVETQLKMGW
jgi:hypothetical protein